VGLKSRSLNRLNLEALYNTFLGLTPREQTFALIGAGVALLIVVGLPVSLASSKLSSLEEAIEKGQENRRQVVRQIEGFQQMEGELKKVEGQLQGGFDATITTTMETLATEAGIKERIDSLKERPAVPSEFFDELAVDVRLTKVTLPQLTDLLYKIEHHSRLVLRVKQMQIKPRFDNKQLLDATFQVSTYRLQQGGA